MTPESGRTLLALHALLASLSLAPPARAVKRTAWSSQASHCFCVVHVASARWRRVSP